VEGLEEIVLKGMRQQTKVYLGAMFWGVGCFLVAFFVGSGLGWSGRKIFFLVIFTLGIYFLGLVSKLSRKDSWSGGNKMGDGAIEGVAKDGTLETFTEVTVDELLNREEDLTAEEIRFWLDRFLVYQQASKQDQNLS